MKQQQNGALIVIEGSDGSGKATQSRLLVRRLRAAGVPAVRIAFPGYQRSRFGRMVGAYLRGEYGAAVDPHLAAVLYAGDRFEARDRLRRWLAEGKTVVCDRYVDSNKAHQAARLPGPARREFLRWVDRLEYGVFKLPRPDFTLFLHVPSREASRRIDRKPPRAYLKGKRRDVHEADTGHLVSAQQVYVQLARSRSRRRGALIDCTDEGRLLAIPEVGEKIWEAVRRRGMVTQQRDTES